jgi:hypothetical protein
MDYCVWEADPAGFCSLQYLSNVDDVHDMKKGLSRAENFPEDACFHMDPDFPRAIKLADNLFNLDRMAVVSDPLKNMIAERDPKHTEMLKVSIINHKERVAADNYWIVHPTLVVDCIDRNKSNLHWNKIDPNFISGCFGLVLKQEEIDPDLLFFRPKHLPTIILVREDLAEEIEDEGFSGLCLTPTDEFEL